MNNKPKELTPEIARAFLDRFHSKETLQPECTSWSYYEVERTSWGGPNAWFPCGPSKFDTYKFESRDAAAAYINDKQSAKYARAAKYRIVKIEKKCEYEYF